MLVNTRATLCIIVAVLCVGKLFAVEPIWLSPTNVDISTPDGDESNLFESYMAEKGVWANLTGGVGSRAAAPLIAMDSKGILWIMFGQRRYSSSKPFTKLYNVWNYDPKTDLYRYVWGNNHTATADVRNAGELYVPSETNHPGYIGYSAVTVDKDDNLWFFSYSYIGELWMFNTTSMMFTRMFGLDGSNDFPSELGVEPGQPGAYVWPGYNEGHCMVTDSKNNIWMLGGSNGYGNIVNTVWHFNMTSRYWSHVYGSFDELVTNETFYGGAWMSGCFIDENDKVWLYGGYGNLVYDYSDSSGMWSFDTRGKREYEREYGPEVLNAESVYPVLAGLDYHAGNHPGACTGCTLVDRMDGTLMLFVSGGYTTTKFYGGTSHAWQYSKSLKQWRRVYGDVGAVNMAPTYNSYRQPGSFMPGLVYNARSNGQNMNGDIYIVGGSKFTTLTDGVPGYKDIWLIPNDQCSSPAANKCDANADCIEEMIGYSCECKQGYTGDGFTCTAVATPVAEGPIAAPVAAPVGVPVSSPLTPSSVPVSRTPSAKASSASVRSSIVVVALAVIALWM